jgi:hypothetical protein
VLAVEEGDQLVDGRHDGVHAGDVVRRQVVHVALRGGDTVVALVERVGADGFAGEGTGGGGKAAGGVGCRGKGAA